MCRLYTTYVNMQLFVECIMKTAIWVSISQAIVIGLGILFLGIPELQAQDTHSDANVDSMVKQRVAIFNLQVAGQSDDVAKSLMATLTKAVASVPGYQVISRDEIANMLDAETQKQMLGCDDSGCLAEIAGALDVELLITGSVTPLDKAIVLNLQLINQRYANVMNRVSLTWDGPSKHLPQVMCSAAQLLVLEKKKRPPVQINLEHAPAGTVVFIDAKQRGTIDAKGRLVVEKVQVGIHKLVLRHKGYNERTLSFASCSGHNITIDATMQKTPFYANGWFWAGAGTLGLATVAAVVIVIALANNTGRVTVNLAPEGVTP